MAYMVNLIGCGEIQYFSDSFLPKHPRGQRNVENKEPKPIQNYQLKKRRQDETPSTSNAGVSRHRLYPNTCIRSSSSGQ